MDQDRQLRLENKIKREMGELLLREVEFPAGVIVTVSGVALKRRREFVDVFVAVFPSENKDTVMGGLERQQRFLQRRLTRKLGIHPMPKIRFFYDEGAENAARVEKQFIDNEM